MAARKYVVITKTGRQTFIGTPAQIVKQMMVLDHRNPRTPGEYMENVRSRLLTIGVEINFTRGRAFEFLEALACERLIEFFESEQVISGGDDVSD